MPGNASPLAFLGNAPVVSSTKQISPPVCGARYAHPPKTLARRRAPSLITCCSSAPAASSAAAAITALRDAIESKAGSTRGLFGLEDTDRAELDALARATEALSPTVAPTVDDAAAAAGRWRLLYTTLQILGRKRVRLAIGAPGSPGAVTLGEFEQIIDPGAPRRATSVVNFDVMGGITGTFTIDAQYDVVRPSRVKVRSVDNRLAPEALQTLLGGSIDLLTDIFSPDGWLDITYVDDNFRIGRDDKGLLFVLEKVPEEN